MKVRKTSLYESILSKYEDLCEVYFAPELLDAHHSKHVLSDEDGKLRMEYMTKEEYDELANTLSSSPAGSILDKNADIVGYVSRNGTRVKFDKKTSLLVAYTPFHTISLYKQPYSKFLRKAQSGNPKILYGRDLEDGE